MRKRLSRSDRRSDILKKARGLFVARGYSATEMEDIRLLCEVSRGGLYHHFSNKRAILDALIDQEIAEMARALEHPMTSPIAALLAIGSDHLGANPGIWESLEAQDDKQDYLSGLDRAIADNLLVPLTQRLDGYVRKGADPSHVAELFLTVNAHINRRQLMGEWDAPKAAGFAATALCALAPLLRDPSDLTAAIETLQELAGTS